MVKGDRRRAAGMQLLSDLGRLGARVAVDDRLRSVADEPLEIRELVGRPASVDHVQVVAHRGVDDPGVDAQRGADLREGVVAGGRGQREHLRSAQRFDRRTDALVRRPMRRLGQMVGFIDDDERRP